MTPLCVGIKTEPILLLEMHIFLVMSSDCVEGTMAERDPAGRRDMTTKRVIVLEIQASNLCFCGSLIDSPCSCFN